MNQLTTDEIKLSRIKVGSQCVVLCPIQEFFTHIDTSAAGREVPENIRLSIYSHHAFHATLKIMCMLNVVGNNL